MRNGCTFFTSEESKLAAEEEFKKVRDSVSDFQSQLDEIKKPTPVEEVDPDTSLWYELNKHIIIPWQFYDAMPKWRIRDTIVLIKNDEEEGNSSSIVERGILAAINRICQELGGD